MEPTGPATLHENMPASEYHNDPAPEPSLSSHVARELLSCPAAAYDMHPRLGGRRDHDESKFDLGTSAHAMLLEGNANAFVVIHQDDWRKKVAQEARDEAHAAGKAALLAHQFDDVQAMVRAAEKFIAESEFVTDWRGGKSEQSIVWKDGAVWCRARLDRLSADHKIAFDYKTCAKASGGAFGRTIVNLGYAEQDSFYRRAIRALDGFDPTFIFLAQESEAPFRCAWHGCDPGLRAVAEFQTERAIDLWRECLTTGVWPAYGNRVHWHNAPAWMMAQNEALLMEHT